MNHNESPNLSAKHDNSFLVEMFRTNLEGYYFQQQLELPNPTAIFGRLRDTPTSVFATKLVAIPVIGLPETIRIAFLLLSLAIEFFQLLSGTKIAGSMTNLNIQFLELLYIRTPVIDVHKNPLKENKILFGNLVVVNLWIKPNESTVPTLQEVFFKLFDTGPKFLKVVEKAYHLTPPPTVVGLSFFCQTTQFKRAKVNRLKLGNLAFFALSFQRTELLFLTVNYSIFL